MLLNTKMVRSAIASVIGAGAFASAMFVAIPSALSDDLPPNCTIADRAGVAAGVSAAMSAYLFTHPEINGYVTGLTGQPRDQVRSEVQAYLDTNPQAKAEIQGIRQPLVDLRTRCNIDDISVP